MNEGFWILVLSPFVAGIGFWATVETVAWGQALWSVFAGSRRQSYAFLASRALYALARAQASGRGDIGALLALVLEYRSEAYRWARWLGMHGLHSYDRYVIAMLE